MIRSGLLALICALTCYGSSTTAWEMSTYQDFLKGRFSGLSLTRDGRLLLAPKADVLFSSDQPSVWSVVEAPDSTFYVATGNRGKVYNVTSAGKTSLVWTSPQPEVFALAVGPEGALYAGTSPDGRIYKLQGGKAEEYFNPQSKYIWALAFGKDGALYAGTGDDGKIFRITARAQGTVYYETGQSHVTCLAFDRNGHLLAGSEPNGILYRVLGPEKAFVLYDANLPEIRSISVAPDGAIYAAALGGSIAQRTTAATAAAATTGTATTVIAPGTSITVTDDSAQAGPEFKPKVETKVTAATSSTVTPATVQTVEVSGVDKSALFRINPDNTIETLWSSKDENAYDMLLSGNQILFSTDAQGRVYRLGTDRRVTLLTQTNEGEATRLLASHDGKLLVATSTLGKLLQLTDKQDSTGTYESPVHDAASVARWGQLSWRGEKGANSKLIFRTRSGNSARPDKTWSDWSEGLADPRGSSITSPNARFIQWKAEFASNTSESPTITGVSLAYLPQNNPPVVHAINVSTQLAAATTSTKSAAQPSSTGAYSITVTDTGESGASTLSGTSTQSVARGLTQQIQITWAADDPDGDRLVYALYFRGEDEKQWKLLRGNFADSSLTLEGDVFADGKYFFRVVASDRPSNAASASREADLISSPVLFDSTPPVIRTATPRRTGAKMELQIQAADATSSLRRAEYSLDAGSWVPLEADDGIIDGRDEKFTLKLDGLAPGEHLIVIRVYDASNNAGLSKVVIE